nr:MAG TPA: hypothetical protein [Caudoviricetes sp.]
MPPLMPPFALVRGIEPLQSLDGRSVIGSPGRGCSSPLRAD